MPELAGNGIVFYMEESWKTFGHNQVKKVLSKQRAAGSLPHAYLFLGPEGVGKKTLAQEFARKILASDRLEAHPDFFQLDNGGEEIIMEEALRFISQASTKPLSAKFKIGLLDNAHLLNVNSANLLLKTLEEPGESSLLILIASAGVLPTIASRCQIFHFAHFKKKQISEFALEAGLKTSPEMLRLSFGRPGKLFQLNHSKDFFSKQEEALKEWERIRTGNLVVRLSQVPRFADMEEAGLADLLNCWLNLQSDELAENPSRFRSVNALLRALQGLRQNLNKKLLLQNLFVNL